VLFSAAAFMSPATFLPGTRLTPTHTAVGESVASASIKLTSRQMLEIGFARLEFDVFTPVPFDFRLAGVMCVVCNNESKCGASRLRTLPC
jgi:hypothetical protein